MPADNPDTAAARRKAADAVERTPSFEQLNKDAAERAEDFSYALLMNNSLRMPWPDLDRLVGMPLLPGWLVLLGARAKSGKSSIMRGLFQAWANDMSRRVLYVGTEQEAEILGLLMAAERLNISPRLALDPTQKEHPMCLSDYRRWSQSTAAKYCCIVAEPDLTMERFVHWCRVAYKRECDAVLLDHFNRFGGATDQSRWAKRGEDVRSLKTIATRSGMTIVAAAQLANGEGGALLGLYEVPGPGSWAETSNLRREADVAIQAWRPFKAGVTQKLKARARSEPRILTEIIQRNTMALRLDAHRYNPEAEDGALCRLAVVPGGGLASYASDPTEPAIYVPPPENPPPYPTYPETDQ